MQQFVTENSRQPSSVQPAPHKPGLARTLLVCVALAAVLAAVARLWGARTHARERGPAAGAIEVQVGVATPNDVAITLDRAGKVTPLSRVLVGARIGGKLIEVKYREGQNVKKGDVLAQIDPKPHQAALAQIRDQLASDESMLATAKVDLARYGKAIKTNGVARYQVERQWALVHQYEANVNLDNANIESAALYLSYCRLISPIDGRITQQVVNLGDEVTPGDTKGAFEITQLQPISVMFDLPQDDIPGSIKNLRGGGVPRVVAYAQGASTILGIGEIAGIDNHIDPTTDAIKLRAIFPNRDEKLLPNQLATLTLVIDILHNATVVPASAVHAGAFGGYVYLVNPDATISVRPVKRGQYAGTNVVIQEGLVPGDEVVLGNDNGLWDGAKIRILDTPRHSGELGSARHA